MRIVSVLLAVFIAWSSVEDNAVVCGDDSGAVSDAGGPCSSERQQDSAPCTSCPCRLPIIEAAALPGLSPVLIDALPTRHTAPAEPSGLGAPAPAIPPPLA
ncbi:MAG: hypothetical protein JST92_12465 [Deltaproteobacteria bacterium]|nr:hypothetical protein [Deltaproteobacteria bacterium]